MAAPVQAGEAQTQLQLMASGGGMDLVASLQVQQEQQLAFMCGSLLVPTGDAIRSANFSAPAVVQCQRTSAPRYRLLPKQTNLNSPPSQAPCLPVLAAHDPGGFLNPRGGGQSLSSLALTALLDYGDTIDIVAPVDILKQIFKTPYSKAPLSVGVHRVGQTLVLCSGPDSEESEKVLRRKKNGGNGVESKLFSKFVQHSVNGHASEPGAEHGDSASAADHCQPFDDANSGAELHASSFGRLNRSFPWQLVQDSSVDSLSAGFCASSQVPPQKTGKQSVSWMRGRYEGGLNSLNDVRDVGEKQKDTEYLQKDAEGHQRPGSDRFLRVLFWEFEHLRMLLGSDLLVFSNEKHAAVSLHLLEIDRQVAPLVWLDAWLDNIMASVPELAVCYHRKGVVQGYELLKTEDIFLVKGLTEDGTATFHPHVVQQNASTILRFLQENCKHDPGTYWLFKNAGEDLLHLFDLSAMSKTRPSRSDGDQSSCGILPSFRKCSKGRYALPLAMLLYRLAHSFVHSENPIDQGKCANLFEKCLESMDEQEHLVVRSSAHEHVGRVMLNCARELGMPIQSLLMQTVGVRLKKCPLVLPSCESAVQDAKIQNRQVCELTDTDQCSSAENRNGQTHSDLCFGGSSSSRQPDDINSPLSGERSESTKTLALSACAEVADSFGQPSDVSSDVQFGDESVESMVEPETADGHAGTQNDPPYTSISRDPLTVASTALTAVHHISQAIKALRWQRKLDDVGSKGLAGRSNDKTCLPCNFSGQGKHHAQVTVCVCGDIDCVPLCDIRDPELGYRMDHKLWRLVLLLGEAYLTLGQAYKDAGEFTMALRAAELACLVRSCIPQLSVDGAMMKKPKDGPKPTANENAGSQVVSANGAFCGLGRQPMGKCDKGKPAAEKADATAQDRPGKGLFWGQLWMFIGDVYTERQRFGGQPEVTAAQEHLSASAELTVMQDVVKEVKRLKKRIVHSKRNCSVCSVTSCSCQSERVDSGSSASSSRASSKGEASRVLGKIGKKSVARNRYPGEGSSVAEDMAGSSSERGAMAKQNVDAFSEIASFDAAATSSKLDVISQDRVIQPMMCASVGDICPYLRRPMTGDWQSDLLAAVKCYQVAALAFDGFPECRQERESALRKAGWAANELGRRRLQLGNITSAEESFQVAMEAFGEVKDFTNIVLVHCNLGHGHRACAEKIVSQIIWEESSNVLQQNIWYQAVSHAKAFYAESLRQYNRARQELNKVEGGIEGSLCNEVYTQLAHTYVKLGMLLSREENLAFVGSHLKAEQQSCEFSKCETGRGGKGSSGKKSSSSARDAITKALVLYQSFGTLRAQEAAFAQLQLARHEKDCCMRSMASEVEQYVHDKSGSGNLQAVKRHASLAELYWQKAVEFYRPETHCDMYLQIQMERCALCIFMAPLSHLNPMLDLALTHLLEGRRCLQQGGGSSGPSDAVVSKYVEKLRVLLKKMLSVALNSSKLPASGSGTVQRKGRSTDCVSVEEATSSTSSRRGGDVGKLRDLYRQALQAEPDIDKMYAVWVG